MFYMSPYCEWMEDGWMMNKKIAMDREWINGKIDTY